MLDVRDRLEHEVVEEGCERWQPSAWAERGRGLNSRGATRAGQQPLAARRAYEQLRSGRPFTTANLLTAWIAAVGPLANVFRRLKQPV
jgi:hypothetical protein